MWQIEIHRGDAATFHARPMPAVIAPSVWWFEVGSSALVLGSSQSTAPIDTEACARHDIAIVRRRSGGGAVLLQPGDVTWVDILLPPAHPRWTADVGRSAWWLGEVWQAALAELGVVGTDVHREPMINTPWSERLCFAGVGGGEVLRDGRKVVGISQRRTRAGARFQCAVYRHWRPALHAELLSPPGPTAAELADLVEPVHADSTAVMAAFERVLTEN